MKQIRFGFIVLLFLTFAVNGVAQQYGILKPTRPGRKSDVIPLSKKQYENLIRNKMTFFNSYHKNLAVGIEDTIGYVGITNANFGLTCGDTLSSYYDPQVACIIKAIGIIGRKWGSEPLAPGYNLFITKSVYPWHFPRSLWEGGGCYTKDSLGYPTVLGEKMWGDGPVAITDGERVWTSMTSLGQEPDSRGTPFIVSIAPYGRGWLGTDAFSLGTSEPNDELRLAKYYHQGRIGHEPQFVARDYSCNWLIVVEFYGPPIGLWIDVVGHYGSVLNANPRPIRCSIRDFQYSPNQAGVVSANLIYQINDGEEKKIPMELVDGDSTNGIWEGVLPAGYMNPGDVLSFRITATNKAEKTRCSEGRSFSYFVKQNNLLFYYNDNVMGRNDAKGFYWGQCSDYQFDTWYGEADGSLVAELLAQYDYVVRVDGNAPIHLDNEVFANWLMMGNSIRPKHLFWSSQEFLGTEAGWVDTTYAEDDWHNQYLGIGGVIHDLQYRETGKSDQPYPLNAVLGDVISGNLAKFCADSNFQLLHNPTYELGVTERSDGLVLGPGAVACFFDTTMQIPMGLHKKSQTTKTVFLAFDQLALDINPPYETPGYVWPEFESPSYAEGLSLLEQTLKKFWWRPHPHNSIDTLLNQSMYANYLLQQNYPNPFNNQTKIFYNISVPGHVILTVHNVLGQTVAQLKDDFQQGGRHYVIWDAGKNRSGIYFCRLQIANNIRQIKMLLVR